MFYIRADGNHEVGMGHIARCLSIATEIKKQGEDVMFLIASEEPANLITANGFSYQVLFSDYKQMETELPQFVMFFSHEQEEKKQKVKILVDSYYVTNFYLENIRLFCQVILLDDTGENVYACDMLINYNIYAEKLGYEMAYSKETQLILGNQYVPIRPEFIEQKDAFVIREQVQNVMFTTGGGDSEHIALAFCKEIREGTFPPEITYHIVCGPFCPDTEELREIAKEVKKIVIHEKVKNMAELMKKCDVVFSAAGSTLYELCALGIPTIGFYFADNQKRNMDAFAENAAVPNAGDYRNGPEKTFRFLGEALILLKDSYVIRKKNSESMQKVIDGKGAQRLAKKIMDL